MCAFGLEDNNARCVIVGLPKTGPLLLVSAFVSLQKKKRRKKNNRCLLTSYCEQTMGTHREMVQGCCIFTKWVYIKMNIIVQ